jgi:hypothetical protein
MGRFSFGSSFVLGVVAGSLVAGTAHADIRNASFWKGAAVVKENHHRHDGTASIFDVEVRRFMTAHNQKDQICEYQAQVKLTLPNGYTYTDESPVRDGCTFYGVPAWFTFPQYGTRANHDDYPEGSVFEGWWRDNHTGEEYKRIGSRTL